MLRKRTLEEIIGAVGGAGVGAVVGSIAGGLGAIIGAFIGAIGGFGIGAAVDREESRTSFHDRELDKTIGVDDGTMGARGRVMKVDEDAWYV